MVNYEASNVLFSHRQPFGQKEEDKLLLLKELVMGFVLLHYWGVF